MRKTILAGLMVIAFCITWWVISSGFDFLQFFCLMVVVFCITWPLVAGKAKHCAHFRMPQKKKVAVLVETKDGYRFSQEIS